MPPCDWVYLASMFRNVNCEQNCNQKRHLSGDIHGTDSRTMKTAQKPRGNNGMQQHTLYKTHGNNPALLISVPFLSFIPNFTSIRLCLINVKVHLNVHASLIHLH